MVFSKIKVGKSVQKRSKFYKSHDVNTTSSFGFMQPCLQLECLPNSLTKVNCSNFTRLMPMPLPTFGRVQMRMYHQFVPIREICPQHDYLISKLTYNTSNGSYIPTSVLTIPLNVLTMYILNESVCSVYAATGTDNQYSLVDEDYARQILEDFSKDFVLDSFGGVTSNVILDSQNPLICNPNNADYVLRYDSGNYLICWRFTDSAKNLRKIFIGLGYAINLELSDEVSVLPLFAYYKAYFDIFAIKRTLNWENTLLHKIINYCYNNNIVKVGNFSSSMKLTWNSFINLLAVDMYFNDDNDFISVHQLTPSLSPDQVINYNDPNTLDLRDDVNVSINSQPRLDYDYDSITSLGIRALNVLTRLVNKRSIFGKDLSKYLKDEYNLSEDSHKNSKNIGDFAVMLNISDVMSTAETADGSLGEYAGKGFGSEQNKTFEFESSEWGYWISMFTVVPISDYVQGLDQNLYHTNYDTFYHPEFDALGFQITPKTAILASIDNIDSNTSKKSGSFAFVPRYTEMKSNCCQSILNGELSMRSTRDNMLPFTIDKFITPNKATCQLIDSRGVISGFNFVQTNLPVEPSAYREISRYKYLQNYDRIFTNYDQSAVGGQGINQEMTFDNFVCHNVFDIEVYAPMLPVSESFDTDPQNEKAQTVDKS